MKKIFLFSIVIIFTISSCKQANPEKMNISGEWKFKTGDNTEWANPEFNDSDWKSIKVGISWEAQGYEGIDGYAWYRVKFFLPSSVKQDAINRDSVLLVLGKIDDYDQTYLNGKLIGENGQALSSELGKTSDFTKTDSKYYVDRNYVLAVDNKALLWDKENVLAVRVYDSHGEGGIKSQVPEIRTIQSVVIKNGSVPQIKSGEMTAVIEVKNIHEKETVKGKLQITIINIENDLILKEENKDIDLKFLEPVSHQIALKADNSIPYKALCTFTDKKFGTVISHQVEFPYLLTPPANDKPIIHSPAVYGARPGNPFLYSIPVTGKRPVKFLAIALPKEITLDEKTGIIKGITPAAGKYMVVLKAENESGKTEKRFTIISGNTISLTPYMGWNSWYVLENRVRDEDMRAAADAIVLSGLKDHGYDYVDIDDCWMVKVDNKESDRSGTPRDKNGKLIPNKFFPDMNALTVYIHQKGLKAGIYTSPGPRTCGGYEGAYKHEEMDVKTFSDWGFDLLKYDWCSYGEIAPKPSLDEFKKPYKLMGDLVKKQKRDMIFNLCQYGMGDVWEWGEEVGGTSWRTTGDLGLTFEDIPRAVFEIGFGQNSHEKHAHPGAWNDPDYLLLGYLSNWKGSTSLTPLTPNEQYLHFSLWCILASPLIFSGDITRLDEFTLNILTNDEVIAVDQDSLGKQGYRVKQDGNIQIWIKELADGSKAVGLFNLDDSPHDVTMHWEDIKVQGKHKLRDLWRQKDLGEFDKTYTTRVLNHGVVLIMVKP
jgi:alpha-galactosidase